MPRGGSAAIDGTGDGSDVHALVCCAWPSVLAGVDRGRMRTTGAPTSAQNSHALCSTSSRPTERGVWVRRPVRRAHDGQIGAPLVVDITVIVGVGRVVSHLPP